MAGGDGRMGAVSRKSMIWLPRSLGKTVPASCQSRQPSRHTSESALTRPSLSQVFMSSPAAGPNCPPDGGRTYQIISGASAIGSGAGTMCPWSAATGCCTTGTAVGVEGPTVTVGPGAGRQAPPAQAQARPHPARVAQVGARAWALATATAVAPGWRGARRPRSAGRLPGRWRLAFPRACSGRASCPGWIAGEVGRLAGKDLGRGVVHFVWIEGVVWRQGNVLAAGRLRGRPRALRRDQDPCPTKWTDPPPSGLEFLDVKLVSVGTIEAYAHRCSILPQKPIITRLGCVGR